VLNATPDIPFAVTAIELEPIRFAHSIISKPSKLLLRKELAAAPQAFTVILAVEVLSTSIGAGLRAVRPEVIFRDLSPSKGS